MPEDKWFTDAFGRIVLGDLITRQGEFEKHLFPLNIVFDSISLDKWRDGY